MRQIEYMKLVEIPRDSVTGHKVLNGDVFFLLLAFEANFYQWPNKQTNHPTDRPNERMHKQ